MPMQVDMRLHLPVRAQVHAGIAALIVQGRQIWGEKPQFATMESIAVRLMVGVGDLARLARDGWPQLGRTSAADFERHNRELKKEFGNILFSTIRWIDDLGLDPLECLDLAIEAQEKFAKSGRAR
jgi:hypothetical protein